MATRKRSRSGNTKRPSGGALGSLRRGFRRAARGGGKGDRTLIWIFWGLVGLFILLFALSFVRP